MVVTHPLYIERERERWHVELIYSVKLPELPFANKQILPNTVADLSEQWDCKFKWLINYNDMT